MQRGARASGGISGDRPARRIQSGVLEPPSAQPAISRRVHLLERELGAPLFERIHAGVVLTDAGRAFLPHAEALLASMRDGIDAVDALRGTSQGTVTLAIVGTLAGTTLTECLRRFREAYPGIDLRIRTALSAEVSALVRHGDATLGLRYDVDPHPDLVSATVHHEPLVPVCSAQHRLARARRVEVGGLAAEPWITFPVHPGAAREPYSSALEVRLAACGLSTAEIIPIDSLTAQKRMVEAGFGLALLPASSVDEELRAGTLRQLRVAAMRGTIPVVLIHRRRAFQSGATRALSALLADWHRRAERGGRRLRVAAMRGTSPVVLIHRHRAFRSGATRPPAPRYSPRAIRGHDFGRADSSAPRVSE